MYKRWSIGHVIQNEGNTIAVQLHGDEGKIALFFKDIDHQVFDKNLKVGETVKVRTRSTIMGEIFYKALRVK